MKRYILIAVTSLMVAACSQNPPANKKAEKQQQANCKYTCTMDKDVCSDKPGVCPKCGMELVEKADK
ncbi:heavy metal-binding domain-containing protein [Mucilaginibacter sp. KACC 22063]|uniref:heavy metal-binding domain-containing protein n=1 Tax=Mucilaginibacter sp. KACC 22063 TaxID=3025666 RepID=UPI002365E392|nr:heavy metal-binding domain-containing protein [Mucilaginibacter sp. KACC 22063]WDF57048.1 heavy metal-binding domain-containing protein [Mucilaginibacter sp. KACC 22063]